MFVAACGLGTSGCIGARIGQGMASLEPVLESTYAITLWWYTGRPQKVYTYESRGIDRVHFKGLVDKDDWRKLSF